MSTPPRDSAASRAEARRRSRLAARGELPEEEEADAEPPADSGRGGFLGRTLPARAGAPEPAAGRSPASTSRDRCDRSASAPSSFGGTRWRGWAPGSWRPSAYFALERLLSASQRSRSSARSCMFGALIAAGWFGWQRPTLFGTAAAIFGFVLVPSSCLSFDARCTPEHIRRRRRDRRPTSSCRASTRPRSDSSVGGTAATCVGARLS